MIKLIGIDLDGTLIDSNSEISKKDEDSIKRCIKEGIKIVIVSAKSISAVMKVVNKFGLKYPQIAFGGASIINNGFYDKENKLIPESYCKDIISLSRDSNKPICVGTSDGYFYFEKYYPGLEEISKGGEVIKKIRDLASDKIIKNALLMTIIMDSNDKFNNLLIQKYHTKLKAVRGGKYFLDISNIEASKLNGLKKVLERLNIERSEIMAIGDSESDLKMIEYSGIGVAMENSSDDVKRIADHITYSNDNNGVYHIINKIIFNNDIEL